MKLSRYHRMSAVQKRTEALSAAREPAVACPSCDTQVMPTDLLAHGERCTGPRAPVPGSKWVTWREARALGVLPGTLSKWIERGHVRFLGERQDRRYLLRDLALRISVSRGFRRR